MPSPKHHLNRHASPGQANTLAQPYTLTCSWQMPAMVPASRMRNTPAAAAAGASRRSSAPAARCAATSEDEHAVCVARQGPARGEQLWVVLYLLAFPQPGAAQSNAKPIPPWARTTCPRHGRMSLCLGNRLLP